MSVFSYLKKKIKTAYKKLTNSANRSARTQQSRRSRSTSSSSRSTGTSQHRGGSTARSNQNATRSAYVRRSSGGSSSNSSPSGWGSNRSGGTAQHRSGSQGVQKRSQPEKKQNQTSWQSWVQKSLKTAKNNSQSSAQEAYKKRVKENRNALGTTAKTRTSGNLKSRDLSSEDYLKLQNASRIGGKAGTASLGKDLAEKVGSRTAYAANRNRASRVATGVMQGLAYGDVIEGGVGTYNKAARAEIEKAKKSTGYNVGYGVGQMAGFALGGTSGAAKSLVSGGAKAGAKAAAKEGAQSTAKKFARNRAAEMAVETPMNIADAIKMSRDENGKIDKKKLAEYTALNTALTGGAGAVMEGAAIKFTKKNGQELLKLQAKANKGSITKEEGQKLKKLYDKLNDARKDTAAAKSNAAEDAYQEGRQMVTDTRIERGKANGAQRAEAARQARTEANNAKVDRAVEQAVESTQKAKNARINDRVAKYVEEVREKNRKILNDRELVSRNKDFIEDGGTQEIKENNIDVEATPEGKRANVNSAKSTRKAARETLASYASSPRKYTKEETKEINDTVDKISNMLAHGDHADARAEAENLARKHGQLDTHMEEEIPGADEYARAISQAKRYIFENAWHMPDGAARTLDEFYEMIGGRQNVGGYIKLRKGFQGHNKTRAVDDQIGELIDQWPELFGDLRDADGYIDETGVFQRMGEIVQTHGGEIPRTREYQFSDEEMDQLYRELADDIVQQAQKNADAFKDTEPKPRAKKSTPKVDETPVSDEPRSGGPEHISSIMDRVKSEAEKRSVEDKAASRQAMKGVDVEAAESAMQKAKNAKTNKDIDAYVEKLKEQREKPGTFKDDVPEKAPEKEPVRGDLPSTKGMTEDELHKDIKKHKAYLKNTENKYGADSPRAKEMRDHIQEAEERLEDLQHERKTGQKTRSTYDAPARQKGAEATLDEPRTRFGKAWKSIYRVGVDSFADIERLAKKVGGDQGQKLLAQTNAVRNAKNIAGAWIEAGRSSWERQAGGKSLNDIFKGVKGNKAKRADFIDYCYHVHNVERVGADKPISGMPRTAAESKEAIETYEKKYGKEIKDFQQDIVKYADDLLQYKVDAGVVSKEEAAKLRAAYKNYIPTFTKKEFSGVVHEAENTGIKVSKGLKEAKGGYIDDELVDLYDQLVQTTNSTMKHCEMNEMIRTLGEIQGVKYADIDKSLSPDDILENSLFVKAQAGGGKKATFYRDGEAYNVSLTEDMYKGIREWTGEEKAALLNNVGVRALATPMRTFKALITDYNLLFGVRNGARDLATALTYTKDIKGYIKAYPKALRAVTNHNDPYYKAYVAAGGRYATLVRQGGEAGVTKAITDGKLSPLKWISEANGLIESMPRMQEFISTIDKAGVKPDAAGKDLIDKAMRNANDVTLNFGRTGIAGKALNAGFTPYFNPSVQGLDKLVRVFTEAKNEGNIRGLLGLGAKVSTFAIAPSVFNEFMLRNDEDYQQLNTRDKDNNYFIPLGKITGDKDDKGKFIKIPKARELVVAAEPFQYFFRYAQFGDSGGWQQMFRTARDNIGVVNPVSENLFSPILRVARNKTWFGGDIESAYDQEFATEDRYDESTSLIGIKLGQTAAAKALKLSPKKIDNIIDSYTGVIGDYLLPATAQASKGSVTLNQFITDSVFSNKLSAEAWDKYSQLEQRTNSKSLSDEEKRKAEYDRQDMYNRYMDDTTKLSRAIADIQGDKNLTKAEKHDLVRNLKISMNEIYRASADGSVARLNGNEVDPLRSIYKTFVGREGTKAVDHAFKYADEKYQDAYKEYKNILKRSDSSKESKAKSRKQFLDYCCDIRGTQGKIGGDKDYINYKTAAVVAAMKGVSGKKQDAFGLYEDTRQTAKTYKKYHYDLKHYIHTERTSFNASRDLDMKYQSEMQSHDIAMAQACKKNDDGSYFIGDKKPKYQKERMPAARYLVKTDGKKWTTEEIHQFADKHSYDYSSDYEEVYEQARKTYKNYSALECAAVAQVITGKGDNDFGDTSLKGDSGIMDGVTDGSGKGGYGRRRGRRGYGRRGGGGGYGGGGGSAAGQDWNTYVSGIFDMKAPKITKVSGSAGKSKVSDFTKDSELNEAYRKRARKKQMINRKS